MTINCIKSADNNPYSAFWFTFIPGMITLTGFLGYAVYDEYYYNHIAPTEARLNRLKKYALNPDSKKFQKYYQEEIAKLEEKLELEQEKKKKKKQKIIN